MQNNLRSSGTCLPVGASLHTAFVLTLRTQAARTRVYTRREFYGFNAHSINAFGVGAGWVSRNYFAGKVTPQDVLVKHTVFGFARLGLSSLDAERASSSLIGGRRLCGELQASTQVHVRGAVLRWCPICADAESGELGFASWHVFHQLPFVLMCPTHCTPLVTVDGLCQCYDRDPIKLRLPGERCHTCHKIEPLELSVPTGKAYRRFVKLCAEAFREQPSTFIQENWTRFVLEFVGYFGSEARAIDAIEKQLCKDWELPSAESIGSAWGWAISVPEVLGLVVKDRYNCSATWKKIVVYDAMKQVLPCNTKACARPHCK